MYLKHKLGDVSSFSGLIGLEIESIDKASCRCYVEIKDQLRNINKIVHGGVIFSLADTSMGVALYSVLEDGEQSTTVEIKINYLKPATNGRLICDAKVLQKGKNLAVMEAEIRNNEQLIAKAIGTFMIINTKKA